MSEAGLKTWQEKINPQSSAVIERIRINRPDSANAFNAELMGSLTAAFARVAANPDARVLVLDGEGKHFSAGADLNWMQESAKLDYHENIKDASLLTAMFEGLAELPLPVIAAPRGAVYGGAVGLVACADIVIAESGCRFCLSEVKLGLLPAVILPYLMRRLQPAFLQRAMLTASVFSAEDAVAGGLVNRVVSPTDLAAELSAEIGLIVKNGPEAMARLKKLSQEITVNSLAQTKITAEAIAAARTSEEGQEGLKAFFGKTKPSWSLVYGGKE